MLIDIGKLKEIYLQELTSRANALLKKIASGSCVPEEYKFYTGRRNGLEEAEILFNQAIKSFSRVGDMEKMEEENEFN